MFGHGATVGEGNSGPVGGEVSGTSNVEGRHNRGINLSIVLSTPVIGLRKQYAEGVTKPGHDGPSLACGKLQECPKSFLR